MARRQNIIRTLINHVAFSKEEISEFAKKNGVSNGEAAVMLKKIKEKEMLQLTREAGIPARGEGSLDRSILHSLGRRR